MPADPNPHPQETDIRQIWSQLTEDEVAMFKNERDEFFNTLSSKYNISREAAENQLKKVESEHDHAEEPSEEV